jgi:sodium/bile acid cotransporter 7
MARPRFVPENFTLMMVATVILASLLPVSGAPAQAFKLLTTLAIAALFFLHGARLSRPAIVAGLTHWRLHLLVLASTFALYPLLGLLLAPLLTPLIGATLFVGVLYLCVLPSTVQSSIAMVALARGNVAAAVCSASASTLLGIFITPLLVGLLVAPQGAQVASGGLDAVGRIVLQLLVPFVLGHMLRPWLGGWVQRRARMLKVVDQGSVLLVVYTAFSAAVIEGLWHQVSWGELVGLLLVDALLLALGLFLTRWLARRLGFTLEDQITITFCGSKKSLASGVPMANVLFSASAVGAILLPIMLYHQMQLMVCVVLAQRYARRQSPQQSGTASLQGQP